MQTLARPAWLVAALSLVLAFAFLGARGIWDPDEGRYTNVAANMLDSGDWLVPMRNADVEHWTKPPLTYWAIAASLAAFGKTPWAARVPVALAYLACVWLAWRIARRLAPGTEATAALAFATMLLPFGASQLVTTDFLLAALQTLAVAAYAETRFGPAPDARATACIWVAFGLAFVTKGPPALLPLAAIVAFEWLVPARDRRNALPWWGPLLFLGVALPWFVAVIARRPELLQQFVGAEVVDRVATDRFGRHGEWYGWLQIYLPTLVLGTLPWTPSLWRWLRARPAALRRWRDAAARRDEAPALFLVLWIALPLLVFCIARSRLPLYLLPLFVPLAIVVAMQRRDEGARLPLRAIAAWSIALIGLKLAAAAWPTHKDASRWAQAIHDRIPGRVREVVFVEDMARQGLRLHLDAEVEKISMRPLAASGFDPEFDEDIATEIAESLGEDGVVFVTRVDTFAALHARVRDAGCELRALGEPFEDRVIATMVDPATASLPAMPCGRPGTKVAGS